MTVPAVHVRISRYFSPRGDSNTRYIYTILVPIKFNLRRNRRSLKMARPCEHPNLKNAYTPALNLDLALNLVACCAT